MKFSDFTAGIYKQQFKYRSFSPSLINQEWTWDDPRINVLLEEANRSLGELNAYSKIVPNVDLYIQMHIMKEATTSSQIEGTNTEFDEALQKEEMIQPERRDDWQEVQNYVSAMNHAISSLERLPLSLRLLCETHEKLMQGVRGENKTPGEFRRSQNWIGGSSLADAAFIPPHQDELMTLLGDLELFMHNELIQVPHLIRCALCHYQFETIHPFLDGNGRVGRLLITLYLVSHGLLNKPGLYLSHFLNQHRGSYYDALTRVRESNDLSHWVRFFLEAITETARLGAKTFAGILQIKDSVDRKLALLGKQQSAAIKLLDRLYANPFITTNEASEILKISYGGARNIILSLVEQNILEEISTLNRNKVFVFSSYLRLFSSVEER